MESVRRFLESHTIHEAIGASVSTLFYVVSNANLTKKTCYPFIYICRFSEHVNHKYELIPNHSGGFGAALTHHLFQVNQPFFKRSRVSMEVIVTS